MATWAPWVNLVGNLLVVMGLGWAGQSLLATQTQIRELDGGGAVSMT
jgi:hypothetical protein